MTRRGRAIDELLRGANPVAAKGLPASGGTTRHERIAHILERDPQPHEPATKPRGTRAKRTGALALVAVLLVTGLAAAAIRWGADDIPAQGKGQYAFSAAVTDHLPEGYNRVRPARVEELPERPAILFGPGVTYTQAVSLYLDAREQGKVLPADVELVDPLPAGISVRVRDDGRVLLDPAAPLSWDLQSHLVAGAFHRPLRLLTLARCQVLLPQDDPAAPAKCGPARTQPFVTESGGRWTVAPAQGVTLPAKIVGSTDLSVLERPRTDADRLPAALGRTLRLTYGERSPLPVDLDYANARLAGVQSGSRLWVIPSIEGVSDRRYYQYTAIDDCTRLRVLQIFPKNNQKTAIAFADYLLARPPFPVETIQIDG